MSELRQQREHLPVIAGSGRSGTTWILDVVAAANKLRPVFEPLHPEVSTVSGKYAGRMLTSDDEAGELKRFLDSAIHTPRYNVFTELRIRPSKLKLTKQRFASVASFADYTGTLRKYRRRRRELRKLLAYDAPIVKFVRGNGLLPWLVRRMHASAVLIVRHPGAVVESQSRLIEHWAPHQRFAQCLADEKMDAAYPAQFRSLRANNLDATEKLAAIWCMENKQPLSASTGAGYQVFFHEELKTASEQLWTDLVAALGLSAVPAASHLGKPSQQSSTEWASKSSQMRTSGSAEWRGRLSDQDCSRIQRILDLFEIDFYRWQEDLPLKSASLAQHRLSTPKKPECDRAE